MRIIPAVRISHAFRKDSLSASAVAVLISLLLVGFAGPLLPIGDPDEIGFGPRLSPPAGDWPLGTDLLGRSLLPRVVEAIGATVVLATTSVLVATILAVVVGMLAAYEKGLFDELAIRSADVLFSFPALLLAMLVTAVLGSGRSAAAVAIVIITGPLIFRVVRATSLVVSERDFVIAARVSGARRWRVLFVHILPNIAGAAIVQATYAISVGMLVESGLSFLGLGVHPPDASLGSLVREGSAYLTFAPWLVFGPGILLALAIVSVNLVGDGLRDLLDPRAPRLLQ